jgi:hypothetical protein
MNIILWRVQASLEEKEKTLSMSSNPVTVSKIKRMKKVQLWTPRRFSLVTFGES